jgi:calmodulin
MDPLPQKDMIHEIDVDGDGEIQFEEFLLLFSRHKKNQLPEDEELRQAFKVFDADGNGTISKVELKRVMDMLGEKLNDAQIDEMMKEADINGDGEIDFGEFKKMMASKGL